MKKRTTQKRKHTPAIYPSDQIAVGTMYPTGAERVEGERGLAQLVWKYFADEITEALHECKQASTTVKRLSTTGNS